MMKAGRRLRLCLCLLGAGLLLAAAEPVFALSASFSVVETGLDPDKPVTRLERQWEDTLINELFDSGMIIVGNSPIARLQAFPQEGMPPAMRKIFETAVKLGADYYVLMWLPFGKNSAAPQKGYVRVYDAAPGAKMIAQGAITGKAGELAKLLQGKLGGEK
jgi:hypothetical protein